MTPKEIGLTLLFLRPNAIFAVRGDQIEWLDENQIQPSEQEIMQGWIDLQAKQSAEKAETEAKKQALLDKLGITVDEAKLLLQ